MGAISERRAAESGARLKRLIEASHKLDARGEPLCIYVTGSYGRLEASSESDLDLFFLLDSPDPLRLVKRLSWLRLSGDLIALVEGKGFPEFSGDGEFLEVHNVARMHDQLGSRTEDSENTFTARLLLLLDSRPIFGNDLYERLLRKVVDFYFEDFSGHADEFRPTFLINDILRFWRTLCINYEYRRRKDRESAGPSVTEEIRAAGELKNLKLGFSRLNTCYSMIVPLASMDAPVKADHVVALATKSPLERWASLSAPLQKVARLVEAYEWFLEFTESKEAALRALQEPDTRADAKKRSSEFGDLVFEILEATAHDAQRRYLTV
jgi:hypothetical protein